jgi:hypothetical protein
LKEKLGWGGGDTSCTSAACWEGQRIPVRGLLIHNCEVQTLTVDDSCRPVHRQKGVHTGKERYVGTPTSPHESGIDSPPLLAMRPVVMCVKCLVDKASFSDTAASYLSPKKSKPFQGFALCHEPSSNSRLHLDQAKTSSEIYKRSSSTNAHAKRILQ